MKTHTYQIVNALNKFLLSKSVFFISLFLSFESSSQSFVCGTTYNPVITNAAASSTNCANPSSVAYLGKYSLQATYLPSLVNPVITVKITFHVINDDNGNGQYQPSGPTNTRINAIAAVIHNYKERYSDNRLANYTVPGFTASYISDSRVNYELTNIYFYNKSSIQNTGDDDDMILNYIDFQNPNRLKEGLPIIFNLDMIQNNPNYAGHAATWNGIPFVHVNSNPTTAGDFFVNENLRHEIGHCMDWWHTYSPGELSIGKTCDPMIFCLMCFL